MVVSITSEKSSKFKKRMNNLFVFFDFICNFFRYVSSISILAEKQLFFETLI